jgi:uncharacterized protein (TIGR00369 family)
VTAEQTTQQATAGAYPPDVHVLRDLRLWIEREAGASRAGLEIVPELLDAAGSARAGVIATLVDAAGGDCAVRTAAPHWVATSDLVLHVTRPVRAGPVHATPLVLRRTRTTVVIEVTLADAAGAAGLATMTFAVLPAQGPVQRMGAGEDAPRTEFARPGSGLAEPLPQRLGVRRLDAAQGRLELPLAPYVGNSLGALQGGVTAILVDLAAEAAAARSLGGACRVSELALNYLALARAGPVESRASLLRRDAGAALLRVELRDAGAGDRLVAVATARAERA